MQTRYYKLDKHHTLQGVLYSVKCVANQACTPTPTPTPALTPTPTSSSTTTTNTTTTMTTTTTSTIIVFELDFQLLIFSKV